MQKHPTIVEPAARERKGDVGGEIEAGFGFGFECVDWRPGNALYVFPLWKVGHGYASALLKQVPLHRWKEIGGMLVRSIVVAFQSTAPGAGTNSRKNVSGAPHSASLSFTWTMEKAGGTRSYPPYRAAGSSRAHTLTSGTWFTNSAFVCWVAKTATVERTRRMKTKMLAAVARMARCRSVTSRFSQMMSVGSGASSTRSACVPRNLSIGGYPRSLRSG